MELDNDSSVQEGYDRQAAAEYEGPGLQEKQKERSDRRGSGNAVNPSKQRIHAA